MLDETDRFIFLYQGQPGDKIVCTNREIKFLRVEPFVGIDRSPAHDGARIGLGAIILDERSGARSGIFQRLDRHRRCQAASTVRERERHA